MENRIQKFIDSEKNLTFCTAVNNVPYCANCFYVFMEEIGILIFKSDRNTKHISNALLNDRIAGTIIPDIHKMGTVKGLQFTGRFFIPENELLEQVKQKYYLKFPFARVIPGDFWAIEVTSVKMIDNTLGFGKKLVWEKPAITESNS
jgi:uncharacterized protein YhbP (UPF0306 family)